MAGVRSLLLVIHAISAEIRCPCQLRRRLAKLMRWVSIEHLFSLGESIAEFVFFFSFARRQHYCYPYRELWVSRQSRAGPSLH